MKQTRKSPGPAGLTLIELLVSMSILSVILLMATQVTESTRNSIRLAESRASNDSEARRAFGQIESDLSAMIVREDARIEFNSGSGNDEIAFLTARQGLTAAAEDAVGKRAVSLVSYRHDGKKLLRGSLGHQFTDTGNDALNLDPDAGFPPISSQNLQAVSSNVFRMEVEYLIEGANGVTVETTAPKTSADLRGLIVTLATLDDRSRQAVKDDKIATLSDGFTDAVSNKNTLKTWTAKRDELAKSTVAGIPKEALQSIRCYQRTFLVP